MVKKNESNSQISIGIIVILLLGGFATFILFFNDGGDNNNGNVVEFIFLSDKPYIVYTNDGLPTFIDSRNELGFFAPGDNLKIYCGDSGDINPDATIKDSIPLEKELNVEFDENQPLLIKICQD